MLIKQLSKAGLLQVLSNTRWYRLNIFTFIIPGAGCNERESKIRHRGFLMFQVWKWPSLYPPYSMARTSHTVPLRSLGLETPMCPGRRANEVVSPKLFLLCHIGGSYSGIAGPSQKRTQVPLSWHWVFPFLGSLPPDQFLSFWESTWYFPSQALSLLSLS